MKRLFAGLAAALLLLIPAAQVCAAGPPASISATTAPAVTSPIHRRAIAAI